VLSVSSPRSIGSHRDSVSITMLSLRIPSAASSFRCGHRINQRHVRRRPRAGRETAWQSIFHPDHQLLRGTNTIIWSQITPVRLTTLRSNKYCNAIQWFNLKIVQQNSISKILHSKYFYLIDLHIIRISIKLTVFWNWMNYILLSKESIHSTSTALMVWVSKSIDLQFAILF